MYRKLFNCLCESFESRNRIDFDKTNYKLRFEGSEINYEYGNEEKIIIDYLKEFSSTTGERASVSISSNDDALIIEGIGPILTIDEDSHKKVNEIMNLIVFVLSAKKQKYDDSEWIDDDFDK